MRELNEIATKHFDFPQDETTRATSAAEAIDLKPAGTRRRRFVVYLAGALLVILTMFGAPAVSSAHISIGFGVSVGFGPPALPYYAQPPCPGPGYIWTPGYWAWDPGYGYYWVPGTWVAAPFIGALWTPGYWDFDDDAYHWHPGYWGLSVGYYGGIDYGYGYNGYGYYGGHWDHDRFFYNRAVNRIEGRDFHTYYRRDDRHFRGRRVSYHGGRGGTRIGPTRHQMEARRMRRFGAVGGQRRQRQFARRNPVQRASFNHGRPGIAATRMPGMFRGRGAVRTGRSGAHRAPVVRMNNRQARHGARARNQNWQSFRGGPSRQSTRYSAPRYAARRGRIQRGPQRQFARRQMPTRNFQRSPQRQFARRQMPTRNFQRSPQRQFARRQMPRRNFQRSPQRQFARRQMPRRNFQRRSYPARRQQVQRSQRYAAARHYSPPQRQQFRGGSRGGGNRGGHGGGHGDWHGHGHGR